MNGSHLLLLQLFVLKLRQYKIFFYIILISSGFEWIVNDDWIHGVSISEEELVVFAVVLIGYGNKVHINIEYHSVCPLVGIGTLPPPLFRQRMCLSPTCRTQKKEGKIAFLTVLAAGRGEEQMPTTAKKSWFSKITIFTVVPWLSHFF
jgi:hypothetical protein